MNYFMFQFQEKTDTSAWYLFYRWIQFASFVVVCIYSIINGNKYAEMGTTRWKWLIFLTNWGYSVCTIQSFLAMAIVQLALINKTHTNGNILKNNCFFINFICIYLLSKKIFFQCRWQN